MLQLLNKWLVFSCVHCDSISHHVGLSVGRSVCWSVGLLVGRSVGLSSKNYKKFIKLYKTLQSVILRLLIGGKSVTSHPPRKLTALSLFGDVTRHHASENIAGLYTHHTAVLYTTVAASFIYMKTTSLPSGWSGLLSSTSRFMIFSDIKEMETSDILIKMVVEVIELSEWFF